MLVTIGIPFFNAEKYLRQSINSILNQSFKNFELILLNDGSTDKSLEIASSFKDPRIRVISDGLNLKLPHRLNQIIDEARGKYIMRMDADDFCCPTRLEQLVSEFNSNPQLDVVFSKVCSVSNAGVVNGFHGVPQQGKVKLNNIIKGQTGMIHATLLAKTSWYKRNRYNPDNRLAEDYELYLTALVKNDFNIKVIDDVLYYYREESNASFEKMYVAYNTQIRVLKKIYQIEPDFMLILEQYKFRIKIGIIFILNKLGLMSKIFSYRGGVADSISVETTQRKIDKILEEIK
ncbi:hypothetical protein BCT94_10600 [Vibrio breoganii]|uniref:glycosyltransferase family 2 protein n=1 Tax=Vibrio breoganii TaxID=553239 RepID=UPI000C8392F3|nr:glycosyltransferase family 2 protein [Vibrio breoganii]PMK74231.1 hypothetical protein BCT94_10600 [Vibrio breoganii]